MSVLPFHPIRRPPAELHSGDRMSREEFHEIYRRTPESFRAELIEGIVYVASPVGLEHGRSDGLLITVLNVYAFQTPGVEPATNTTVILGDDSEPQPDVFLRILPECGGQTRTTSETYVVGAPELVAEVAYSSRAIDLGAKQRDYARYGVHEYLVLSLADQELRWFDLRQNRELQIDPDGILRSQTFPGLWIDRDRLLARDGPGLMQTLQRGLATPEHAAFVAKLAEARQP
ncbi:MAG TPA: Uma2 family endonuclease [Tepidisphaeraceae bacterium]|nr:Uma2 family endonuclease [Tepidisphaeraceae bacterium]